MTHTCGKKSTKAQSSAVINALRIKAAVEGPGTLASLLNQAADLIEEFDERVAILSTEIEAYESKDIS